MYDKFEYYGVPDIDREMNQRGLSEAMMGRPIAWAPPPPLPQMKAVKGLSFEKIKKGQKISFVNRQTGKKQVLTVTEKGDPTHGAVENVFLVGRGGSTYGLHFYKGHKEPRLVRYGGNKRGMMRAVPTEVRVEPGSFKVEWIESFIEACGKSHKKKKKREETVRWHGIRAVVRKEGLEDELQRLESTASPFPEVRERRIEELKVELEEAKRQQMGRGRRKPPEGRGLGPGGGKGPYRGTGLGPGTGECE